MEQVQNSPPDHELQETNSFQPLDFHDEERIHIVSPQNTSELFCPSLIKDLLQPEASSTENSHSQSQSRENRHHNYERFIQHDAISCAALEVSLAKIFEKQDSIFHFLLTILSFRSNIPLQVLEEHASPLPANNLLNHIQIYCNMVNRFSSSLTSYIDWTIIQQESSSIDNSDFEAYALYCLRICLARKWSESSFLLKEIDISAHTGYPETLYVLHTPSPANKRPKHAIVPLIECDSSLGMSTVELYPASIMNPS